MRILSIASAAAIAAAVTAFVPAPAQAQVGIELGPNGPRIYQNDRDSYRERRDERRSDRRRVIREGDEDECRIVIRRRTNQFGETVETRRRVCG